MAERALWWWRLQIQNVRVVGGSTVARFVSAAACKTLGVPVTFSDTIYGLARSAT